jgi:hypothetical protein
MLIRSFKALIPIFLGLVASACMPAYFPTFSGLTPAGHFVADIPVAEVLKQVKCEVQTFLQEEAIKVRENQRKHKLLQIDEDLPTQIDLTLKTDETGFLTFTAIDYRRLGFASLAALISAKNPPGDLTPFLNATGQARAVRSVTVSLLIPQLPPNRSQQMQNAPDCVRENFFRDANKLYIKEWLNRFMDKLDDVPVEKSDLVAVTKPQKIDAHIKGATISGKVTSATERVNPTRFVEDVVLNQIQMSTEFHIVVDVTAGINAFHFTTPKTGYYLIPVKMPPTVEVKADYYHTLTITLKGTGSAAYALTENINKKKGPGSRGVDQKTLKLLLSPQILTTPMTVPSQ